MRTMPVVVLDYCQGLTRVARFPADVAAWHTASKAACWDVGFTGFGSFARVITRPSPTNTRDVRPCVDAQGGLTSIVRGAQKNRPSNRFQNCTGNQWARALYSDHSSARGDVRLPLSKRSKAASPTKTTPMTQRSASSPWQRQQSYKLGSSR